MRDSLSRQRGFTLIEVLVALAIVGLFMAAIFMQLNQSLLAAERLRSKTLAAWIANDRIVELRVSRQYPEPGQRTDDFTMAGVKWEYTVKTTQTAVEGIRRLDVSVSDAERPESSLASVTGFLREPLAIGPGSTDSGWPLQDADAPVANPAQTEEPGDGADADDSEDTGSGAGSNNDGESGDNG